MTDLAAIPLLRLVLEDMKFLAAEVIVDLCGHRRAADNRGADLDIAIAAQKEDTLDGDLVTFLGGQALDRNSVADAYSILLATGFNNRITLGRSSVGSRL